MKRLWMILILIGILASFLNVNAWAETRSERLTAEAEAIQKTLPKMTDTVTIWYKVVYSKKYDATLYYYRVNLKDIGIEGKATETQKDFMREKMEKIVHAETVNSLCPIWTYETASRYYAAAFYDMNKDPLFILKFDMLEICK